MVKSYRGPLVLLASLGLLAANNDFLIAQGAKGKVVPKVKGNLLVPEPLSLNPGDLLSEMTPVVRPTPIKGVMSWTIESRRHRNRPSSFSVSPDGTTVATGGYDGAIHIWDVATGKLLRVLVGHNSSVFGVAFSPDGAVLASTGSYDKSARIWNPKTGMTLRTFKNHKDFTSGVNWSPDGSILAVSGGNSGFVTFWEPIQGKQYRTIEHGMPINGTAWSPDGSMLACGTGQGAVVWNPANGANLGTIQVAGNKVHSVAWSPDSKLLLAGAQKTVDVWDVAGKKLVGSLEGTGVAVSWSPDGETITTSYGDGMQFFHGKNYGRLRVAQIFALAFAWNKNTGALFALTPRNVVVLDVKDEQKKRSFDVAGGDTLMWAPARPIVSGINHNRTLKLWDATTGKLLHTLEGHTDLVNIAAWSRDGKLLATGSNDHTARVWDSANGTMMRVLSGHGKEVKAVAWSPDGRLATASADHIVRVFPADSDKPVELKAHTHPVTAVAWRDSKTLVSGGEDGKVHFWNIETGKPAQTLDVDHDLMALAFSPDGHMLACGSNDDVTRIYGTLSGKVLHTLDPKIGAAEFYNLSWSPDGALIATTNYKLELWNYKTAKILHGYQTAGGTNNISWTPDAKTTVAGSWDRTLRFLDTAKGILRGTMIVESKQIITVSAEGHYKAPADVEADLVYVVQTEKTQDMYEPKAFAAKFPWRNNPAAVKLTGN